MGHALEKDFPTDVSISLRLPDSRHYYYYPYFTEEIKAKGAK
jgi:hypothetical protein